jgi:hypothetical protein
MANVYRLNVTSAGTERGVEGETLEEATLLPGRASFSRVLGACQKQASADLSQRCRQCLLRTRFEKAGSAGPGNPENKHRMSEVPETVSAADEK